MKVKDLVSHQEVVSASIDAKLGEVAALMQEHAVQGIPIVDEWGVLCGLVSASDILRKATPGGARELELPIDVTWSPSQHTQEHDPDWRSLPVRDSMVSDLLTVDMDAEVQEAARALVNRGVHRAVVLGKDRNVQGVIAAMDFVRLAAEAKLVLD